jgi:hypothetical protein
MNMYVQDVNADGLKDIVYSDRERIDCDLSDTPGVDNTRRGVRWLRHNVGDSFTAFQISASEEDHKWFSLYDWEADGDLDIVDCRSSALVNDAQILVNGGSFASWSSIPVTQPTGVGQCQHVVVEDLDQDGKRDLAFSYSNAQALSGLAWTKIGGVDLSPSFTRGEIAGVLDADTDTKFDNLNCSVDVDGDTDKDCVTTEQHVPAGTGPGLGVLYFENPLKTFTPPPPPDAAPPSADVACALLTAGSSTADGTAGHSGRNPGRERQRGLGPGGDGRLRVERAPRDRAARDERHAGDIGRHVQLRRDRPDVFRMVDHRVHRRRHQRNVRQRRYRPERLGNGDRGHDHQRHARCAPGPDERRAGVHRPQHHLERHAGCAIRRALGQLGVGGHADA